MICQNKLYPYNDYNIIPVQSICLGRAVFASCLLDFDGCSGVPVVLSVEEGESVIFNATIIQLPGGSCGFQQEVTNIKLIKINLEFGVDDEVLLSCETNNPSVTTCSNSIECLWRVEMILAWTLC